MRKVAFMVIDTELDQFTGSVGEYMREEAESMANDLNKEVCPVVQISEDGFVEYADPMPERYKAVKVTIEDFD